MSIDLKQLHHSFKGSVHYVDKSLVLGASGYSLFSSINGGNSWAEQVRLEGDGFLPIVAHSHVGRRLFRSGVHHIIKIGDGFIVSVDRSMVTLDENFEIVQVHRCVGSRPLKMCVHGDMALYGEYRTNVERSPIGLHATRDNGRTWEQVLTLNDVRHIHGVFRDPVTNGFLITTGDLNSESQILCVSRDFSDLQVLTKGSQLARAIHLIPVDDCIYYGSDSPIEQNYIIRLDRDSGRRHQLHAVDAPVFHAYRIGSSLYFSTAVEPSRVTNQQFSSVWKFNLESGSIDCVVKARKDFLSMKYFQYGQLKFPAGPGDGRNLWINTFATQKSGCSWRLDTLAEEVSEPT